MDAPLVRTLYVFSIGTYIYIYLYMWGWNPASIIPNLVVMLVTDKR